MLYLYIKYSDIVTVVLLRMSNVASSRRLIGLIHHVVAKLDYSLFFM